MGTGRPGAGCSEPPMTQSRRRVSAVLSFVFALVATTSLASGAADAATQTKWYSASTDVSTVTVGGSAVVLSLTNCGSSTAPCPKSSTQSIGSFNIVLPTGWT